MTVRWEPPLIINLNGSVIVIHSPRDALVFLDASLSSNRGYLYKLAQHRCAENVADASVTRAAQLAFKAAVIEVGIFPAS